MPCQKAQALAQVHHGAERGAHACTAVQRVCTCTGGRSSQEAAAALALVPPWVTPTATVQPTTWSTQSSDTTHAATPAAASTHVTCSPHSFRDMLPPQNQVCAYKCVWMCDPQEASRRHKTGPAGCGALHPWQLARTHRQALPPRSRRRWVQAGPASTSAVDV